MKWDALFVETPGEEFCVDDLQLVDEFIDEEFMEEEKKAALNAENAEDGNAGWFYHSFHWRYNFLTQVIVTGVAVCPRSLSLL